MRKGTYYYVAYGWGGQHGDFIETVQMTKDEFLQARNDRNRSGAYFKKYSEALYYVHS